MGVAYMGVGWLAITLVFQIPPENVFGWYVFGVQSYLLSFGVWKPRVNVNPGIPTTIKTMGVNITTIVYLRVLIIQMGSTIILMVVED